jgi:hypothetical protein
MKDDLHSKSSVSSAVSGYLLCLLVRKHTHFRKLALLSSSGGSVKRHLSGPLDKANPGQGLEITTF